MLVALQPRLPWACVLACALSLAAGCERRAPAAPQPRTFAPPIAPVATGAAVAGVGASAAVPPASEVAAGDRPPPRRP